MNTSGTFNSKDFKFLQAEFATWMARWMKTAELTEGRVVDLPDLVNLLQILGFQIRRIDYCSPEDVTALRDGEKGTRIVVTCNHSGQRCFMEQPGDCTSCTCLKLPSDGSKDGYWEVSACTPTSRQSGALIETGSNMIPSVSKELTQLSRQVIFQLLEMIKGVQVKSEGKDKFYSCDNVNTLNSASSMDSLSTMNDSPARYRSLDTLTSKNADIGFPEPVSLSDRSDGETASELKLFSSPNLTTELTNLNYSKSALDLIKSANMSLTKAMKLIESNNEDTDKNTKSKNPFKVPKILVTSANQSSEKGKRMGSKSTSSPNLAQKVCSSSKSVTPTGSDLQKTRIIGSGRRNSIEKSAKEKPKRTLYGHIKSTIPRPDLKKKPAE